MEPKPDNYDYDLDQALAAVVAVRVLVPTDAFTAETLGTERAGNGVLIRDDGLVLTIGYLITEAETVWISHSGGSAVPGHVLGYDQETGFGLVQALARLDLPALSLGSSSTPRSASESSSAAPAGGSAPWPSASSPSRNSPATGSTCSTRRSSPRPRTRTGAARR